VLRNLSGLSLSVGYARENAQDGGGLPAMNCHPPLERLRHGCLRQAAKATGRPQAHSDT